MVLAGIGGFNLRGVLSSEYSAGFTANIAFVPELLAAYFKYQQREPKLADRLPADVDASGLETLRIGVYEPWPGFALPVLDAMADLELDVQIVTPGSLPHDVVSTVDVVIFPQGGYGLRHLPEGEADRIREWVRRGVHYVGVCAGSILAVRELGLAATVRHHELTLTGLVQVQTQHESFWGNADGIDYTAHFANGGYFSAVAAPFETLAAVHNLGPVAVTGRFGDGEVVLFTFHPGGGGLTLNNQTVYFSGKDLRTGDLFLRALANLVEPRSVRHDLPGPRQSTQ